jgi:hypothetical protein
VTLLILRLWTLVAVGTGGRRRFFETGGGELVDTGGPAWGVLGVSWTLGVGECGGEGEEERAVMAPERGVQSMGTGSSRGTEGGAGSSTPAKFMIISVYFLETFLWQNTSSSVKP